MSDQSKVCPSKKQQDNEQPNKQKTEAVAESGSIRTKLTDVNIDCLASVFMHLSFADLLNIAHTNKELKPAADLIFARQFGKILFVLYIKEGQRQNTNVQVDEKSIKINDLQTALRTVRCFGHLITKLNVSFGWHPSQHQYRLWSEKLVHYASAFCCESLDGLSFERISADGLNDLKKPFVKARVILFDSCTLESKMTPLNTLFPNVSCLQFINIRATPKCIELHFPHLQRLVIEGSISTSKITNTVGVGIFRLNSQLRDLVLKSNCTTKLLRCANENLRLEHLDISCCGKVFHDFGDDVIEFKRLTRLTISFNGSPYKKQKIPILSRKLEEFTWTYGGFDIFKNKFFTDFIKKHPSIRKLKILFNRTGFPIIRTGLIPRVGNISIIAENLPMLQELEFDNILISKEAVISFVGKSMSLKKFRFKIIDAKKFDRLVAELGSQWEASIDAQDQVTLEREF